MTEGPAATAAPESRLAAGAAAQLSGTTGTVTANPAVDDASSNGKGSAGGGDLLLPPLALPKQLHPTRRLALVPGKRSAKSDAGMVVSVNAEATKIGVALLKSGGNAVDAAIGVALALAVTHPSAGNLGGGGFALVHLPNGDDFALDFRESSPEHFERARFTAMIRAGGEGPDSVAIPGTVAGLFELSQRLGHLPFKDLVEPARRLAQLGHRINAREATGIRVAWSKLNRQPEARRLYGNAGRQPLEVGTWLKLPALAETLAQIAATGPAGFYTGPVAASIVASLGDDPQIRLADLVDYRAIWREPLEIPYRDLRVVIMPPPSAGGVALASSLLMLAAYDPSAVRRGSTLQAHLLLEIMRRAQADRIYAVVDPDSLAPTERASGIAQLLDPKRWQRRCPIELDRVTPNASVLDSDAAVPEAEHTTHLAVVDEHGMAVSLTTTLSSGFGSKVVTSSGVVLNNSLASFSGKGLNQPLPHRRTTSSMAPTFIEDERGLRLVLGTPGGDTIPSTLLQLVSALTDYAVPLDEAVDAPRLHQSVARHGQARHEGLRPIPVPLQRELVRLGHRFVHPTGVLGHANSIAIIDGLFYGYVDPREGGLAAAGARN